MRMTTRIPWRNLCYLLVILVLEVHGFMFDPVVSSFSKLRHSPNPTSRSTRRWLSGTEDSIYGLANKNATMPKILPFDGKLLQRLNQKSLQSNVNNADSSKEIIPIGPDIPFTDDTKIRADIVQGSPEAIRYFKIVDNLAPNDLLMKFAKTAPASVQEATKSTIVSILGTLPAYVLESAMLTTSKKLANLLFQMQLTGYMFKNAEYRMSLTKTLKGLPKLPTPNPLRTENISFTASQELSQVSGEVQIVLKSGETFLIPVQDLTSALSQEIQDLRSELAVIRNDRENELKSNLLTYIKALPEKEISRLTSDMSEEILQAMNLLVNALMEKLGVDMTGPEMILQQTSGQLAQLCMWQMIVGYKLRELEALEKGVALD